MQPLGVVDIIDEAADVRLGLGIRPVLAQIDLCWPFSSSTRQIKGKSRTDELNGQHRREYTR